MVDAKALKSQINILDIIQQYSTEHITEVKPNEYKMKCPLPGHKDDNPSFQFNTEKGLWHCFANCSSGGDVFDFISTMEGIDFVEAVKKLSQDNPHIDVDYNSRSFSTSQLMKLVEELKDLENERIFDDNIIKKYCQNKHKYLLELGFKQKTLDYFEIGFGIDRNDEMFNRVTIPWRDYDGNLVAVVGRDITDTHKAKYIAKKGSSKKKHLFNLNNARYTASEGLILVESEKDVMRLWEWGYKNAVAMGNCDLGQRKWLLRRFTDTVYICLDNDEAGQKEIERLKKELKILMNVFTIPLPQQSKDISELDNKDIWLECWRRREKV